MNGKALLFFILFLSLLQPENAPSSSPIIIRQRQEMVEQQILKRGISDPRVLAAMGNTPRHRFVPHRLISKAYADYPLPIGKGQTISQPYIVALMTETLQLKPFERILEIGTGSGYQAAILSPMVKEVYSVEIHPNLHRKARELLRMLGYDNVKTKQGDGYFGWPQAGPFDAIIITAAVNHVPPPLLAQLKDGGRIILPLGNPLGYQNLVLVTRKGEKHTVRQITGVLFVPMTGHAQDPAGEKSR